MIFASSDRRDGPDWHVQRIDEAGRLVGEPHLAVQLLSERPHHAGAKALAYWRLNRGSSAFSPDKAKLLLRLIYRPCDFHAPGRDGKSAKFGRIRTEFIESHRQGNDRA